jgi:hypothetical protein
MLHTGQGAVIRELPPSESVEKSLRKSVKGCAIGIEPD